MSSKELIVGDDGCSYRDVIQVMLQPSNARVVFDGWYRLAEELEIHPLRIRELRMDMLLDKTTLGDTLVEVLIFWRLRQGRKALLLTLIAHLETIGWQNVADILKYKFGAPNETYPAENISATVRDERKGEQKDIPPTKVADSGIAYYTDTLISATNLSSVYEGYFCSEKKKCAVKLVKKKNQKIYFDEIKIWESFAGKSQSNDIVTLICFVHHVPGDYYYIAMELANTTLAKRLEILNPAKAKNLRPTTGTRALLLGFVKNAFDAVRWLHSHDIIHRDIKPDNVLIFIYKDKGEVAKLGDFGISRILDTNASWSTNVSGNDDWLAPEAIRARNKKQKLEYKKSFDIFGLGMVAHYALSLGNHPFDHDGKSIAGNIKSEKVLPFSIEGNQFTANNLLCCMMQKDPLLRPTADQVCNHPLFWNKPRVLKFFQDLANKTEPKETIWTHVDDAYQKYFNQHHKANFYWRSHVDALFFRYKKNYNATSLRSLVELIRDKNQHGKELPSPALDERFFGNKEGIFQEDKYVEYFMNLFPDLLIALFCLGVSQKSVDFKSLKDEYFKDFPMDSKWVDAPMSTLLSCLDAELAAARSK